MARVALLLSGLPRQWRQCAASQLALAAGYDADVFFHFWDTVDEQEKSEIVAAYAPRLHAFEKPRDFTGEEAKFRKLDNINSPSRMLSMYASWREVRRLFDSYRSAYGVEYDFAVRLRSDLMFFAPLAPLLKQLGANDLLLTNHNDFGVVNDMFAVGGVEPIRYYLSLFDRVMEYKDQVLCNPERMLMHHLERRPKEFRLLDAPVVTLVFRPHMEGMTIENCLKQHPGSSKWLDPEIVADHKEFHQRSKGELGVSHVERFAGSHVKNLGSE
jgi:hypothetical protein